MKKSIILIVAVLCMASSAKADQFWGMCITQDSTNWMNFTHKSDYIASMTNNTPFPIPLTMLYPDKSRGGKPMTWNAYLEHLPTMHAISMQSKRTQFAFLNAKTNGQLRRDHGMAPSPTFTDAEVIQIFASDAVFYGDMPDNVELVMNGCNITDKVIMQIKRMAHNLFGQKEGAWFMKITGYVATPISSTYCNNDTATAWLAMYLTPEQVVIVPPAPTPVPTPEVRNKELAKKTNIYIIVKGSTANASVTAAPAPAPQQYYPAPTPAPQPYYPAPSPAPQPYYPAPAPQPVYVNQPCNNCGPANNGKMSGYEKGQLAMSVIGTLGNLGTGIWHEVNAQKGYYGTNVTYNPTTVIHNQQTTPVPVTPVVIQPTDGYPTQGTGQTPPIIIQPGDGSATGRYRPR